MQVSKLPHVGTTIFTTMSALSNEYEAINLSQGFPDFPIDTVFSEILHGTLAKNVHQYAPMMGILPLREEIIRIIHENYNRILEPENVLITAGATQAIFTAIQALIHQNEQVIVLDPAYDCYAPAIQLVLAEPIHVPLTVDFRLNLDLIKQKINDNTKMIIINNPHNPTGTVFKNEDLQGLVDLLVSYPNCLILSDEVYEFITFEEKFKSMHLYEEIRNRLITVSSFGKTLHVTGWKVGYLTAPSHLLKEIAKVHQYLVFSVNHYAQNVIASYLKTVDLQTISPLYLQKRDLLSNALKGSKFKILPCLGTYFQLVDYSEIGLLNDVDFAIWMTKEVGVASIPISVFFKENYDEKIIRLCFAKDDSILTQAAQKLCQI